MAEVPKKSYNYSIIEVDHSNIELNSNMKDKYNSIVKVLFFHNNKEKAIVELSTLLTQYPKEKYTLIWLNPLEVQIFDTEKKSSLLKYYRENKLVKTICICEYAFQ